MVETGGRSDLMGEAGILGEEDIDGSAESQAATETQSKTQPEVWIIDDNAPGYRPLAQGFQKQMPQVGFKIFAKYEAAEKEINRRASDSGAKMPDVILLGNDYGNPKNHRESADKFAGLVAGLETNHPPTVVDMEQEGLTTSGDIRQKIESSFAIRNLMSKAETEQSQAKE